MLHRLLRAGVRPAVVALEVMPTYFAADDGAHAVAFFGAADLALARGYARWPLDYDYRHLRFRYRCATTPIVIPDPVPGQTGHGPRGGFLGLVDDLAPAERARHAALSRPTFGAPLNPMAVRAGADRALRDTLREAAAHGVRVVLLRTPEGPVFRSWYDPAGLARFDAYVAGVAAEFGVPVLDARFWLDEEDFSDSHHVLRRGAEKFTARFAREAPAALAGR